MFACKHLGLWKWSVRGKLLQLRLRSLLGGALGLLALVQLLTSHGVYRYAHIPRDALPDNLYVATNLNLSHTKPNCTYNHILQSQAAIHSWDVPTKYNDFSAEGIAEGAFAPPRCNAQISVALLVPYRNRQRQLDIFLPYMHNFLRKQNIHYKIFVIEQADDAPFNRGALLNAGARAALRERFPCLVAHDVDLLPLHEGNLYACLQSPRHMSASIDKFRFVLPYERLVGGVLALRAAHYARLDGFSNRFYGWGGEDDDLAERIISNGLKIERFPPDMAQYTMLMHRQEPKNGERGRIMAEKSARDGLANVHYEVVSVRTEPLATIISVKL